MNYCPQCKAEVPEDAAFCAKCGNAVVSRSSENHPIQAEEDAQAPETPAYKPSKTKAIAAVLSALLVATMMLGWISLNSMDWTDTKYQLKHDFWNGVRSLFQTERTETVVRNFNLNHKMVKSGAPIAMQNEVYYAVALIIRVMTVLSALGIIGFLSLLLAGNKRASKFGQVAVLLGIICALIFVVYSLLYHGIRPSVWAYSSIILGIITFIVITINKKQINIQQSEERYI